MRTYFFLADKMETVLGYIWMTQPMFSYEVLIDVRKDSFEACWEVFHGDMICMLVDMSDDPSPELIESMINGCAEALMQAHYLDEEDSLFYIDDEEEDSF